MNRRPAWLTLWFVWAIPAFVVVLNLMWLLGLRGAVIGRGSLMAKQRAQVEEEVAALTARLAVLERAQQELGHLDSSLMALRQETLGGMRGRLVLFLLDVVRRAEEAGLSPDRVSYAVQEQTKSDLVHFLATYGVKGSYQQVRELIRLLESSPQFVLVERLGLRGDEAASTLDVDVNLTLGTYFSDIDKGLVADLGIERLEDEIASDAAKASAFASRVTPGSAARQQVERPVTQAPAGQSLDTLAREAGTVSQSPDGVAGQAGSPQVRRLSTRRQAGTVVRPEMTEPVDEFYTNVGGREVSGGT